MCGSNSKCSSEISFCSPGGRRLLPAGGDWFPPTRRRSFPARPSICLRQKKSWLLLSPNPNCFTDCPLPFRPVCLRGGAGASGICQTLPVQSGIPGFPSRVLRRGCIHHDKRILSYIPCGFKCFADRIAKSFPGKLFVRAQAKYENMLSTLEEYRITDLIGSMCCKICSTFPTARSLILTSTGLVWNSFNSAWLPSSTFSNRRWLRSFCSLSTPPRGK